jgi:hypothetical protein
MKCLLLIQRPAEPRRPVSLPKRCRADALAAGLTHLTVLARDETRVSEGLGSGPPWLRDEEKAEARPPNRVEDVLVINAAKSVRARASQSIIVRSWNAAT